MKVTNADNLIEYINILSQQAKNEGRQSKVRSYNSARVSLAKYTGESEIYLKCIDRCFVTGYSSWLKETGITASTQSFYLRTLRSILNRARADGLTDTSEDLFKGLNTRVIFKCSEDIRKTLNREVLNRIASVCFPCNTEAEIVRDMFMFGFYCRGMEMVDVLNLKKTNVQGDMLIYRRRGKGHPRIVPLDKPVKEIISKYWWSGYSYLFPLKEIYKELKQYSLNERVRRHVKRIGNAVGYPDLKFSMNITSWQTLMAQAGVSEMLLKSV